MFTKYKGLLDINIYNLNIYRVLVTLTESLANWLNNIVTQVREVLSVPKGKLKGLCHLFELMVFAKFEL